MKYSEKQAVEIFLSDFDYQMSFKEIIECIETNDSALTLQLSSISATLSRHDLSTLIIEVEAVISRIMDEMANKKG